MPMAKHEHERQDQRTTSDLARTADEAMTLSAYVVRGISLRNGTPICVKPVIAQTPSGTTSRRNRPQRFDVAPGHQPCRGDVAREALLRDGKNERPRKIPGTDEYSQVPLIPSVTP